MATQYLLTDFGDKPDYLSAQLFTNNTINPCMDSAYTFLQHIMSKLKVMHAGVQELRVFHLGGDEVPDDAWVRA